MKNKIIIITRLISILFLILATYIVTVVPLSIRSALAVVPRPIAIIIANRENINFPTYINNKL